MKHLFIIRHGDYNREDGDLSPYGMNQMRRIAMGMKSIVGENYNGHQIISSLAVRAQRSAQVIAEAFQLNNFDRRSDLCTEVGKDPTHEEIKKLDDLVESYKEKDILTLTTHYEILCSYPMYLVKKLFEKEEYIPPLGKGEGVHFNLEKKIYQIISGRAV